VNVNVKRTKLCTWVEWVCWFHQADHENECSRVITGRTIENKKKNARDFIRLRNNARLKSNGFVLIDANKNLLLRWWSEIVCHGINKKPEERAHVDVSLRSWRRYRACRNRFFLDIIMLMPGHLMVTRICPQRRTPRRSTTPWGWGCRKWWRRQWSPMLPFLMTQTWSDRWGGLGKRERPSSG